MSDPIVSADARACRARTGALSLLAALVAALAAASLVSVREADGQAAYEGPKVITAGGTYSGDWQSADPDRPAVEVRTTAPVVVKDCNVRGKGDLIKTMVAGARLTVRDCRGYGVNPGVAGRVKGRFVHAVRAASLTVEHNYLEGTTGIKAYEWRHGAPDEALRVRYNLAKNIDGRKSTGPGYSTDKANGHVKAAQFLMVHSVHDVPGVEVAWNEVREVPNQSRVEDTINFYGSGGSASRPYLVHDNFIDGAFPVDPDVAAGSGKYSGGGIITDGGDVTGETATQHLRIYDNTVVDSLNYGVKITQGHHNKMHGNAVVRDGVLSDGTVYASASKLGDLNTGAGVALWNAQKQSFFGHNEATGNEAGWYDPRYHDRNQRNFNLAGCPSCAVSGNAAPFANPLSDDEGARRTRWADELSASGVILGPRSPQPTADLREEDDPAITYDGAWTLKADPDASGGYRKYAYSLGDAARFSFAGSDVSWVAPKGPGHGIAEVWVDGVKAATVDLYAPEEEPQTPVFSQSWSSSEDHTVEVRVLGAKNPASSGKRVSVDAFEVLR